MWSKQGLPFKIHSREITPKVCKEEQPFYMWHTVLTTKYNQNISKGIKVIEWKSFPLQTDARLSGPNKKMPVLRVTSPYLNLLGNLEFFSGFLEKYNFIHFERRMPFKMHKIIYSKKKKLIKINVWLPYVKFSDPLP